MSQTSACGWLVPGEERETPPGRHGSISTTVAQAGQFRVAGKEF